MSWVQPLGTVRAWISTGRYDTHVDVPAEPDGSSPVSFELDGYRYVLAERQYDGPRHYVRGAVTGGLW